MKKRGQRPAHGLADAGRPGSWAGGRRRAAAGGLAPAMNTNSVLIIGAGVGGLTAAIHLARRGLRVTVLEKNTRPGGRCDRLSRDGHHFDPGPTLLVMPLLYEAEFRAVATSLRQQLDLRRVDPPYRMAFRAL